jgi:hypothetical protein
MRLLSLRGAFAAAALLLAAAAQFTPLGDPQALANTSKPGDGFSVEDKLVPCNNKLVLIDLDSDESFAAFPPQITLQRCGTAAAAQSIQTWAYNPDTSFQLSLLAPPPYLYPDGGTCMDQGGVTVNVSVYPWHCRDPADPVHSNQWWELDPAARRLRSLSQGPKYNPAGESFCLAAGVPGQEAKVEVGLVMALCDDASDAQDFVFVDESGGGSGYIQHGPSGLCVDAGVIGRALTWNGAAWSSTRIVPKPCPDSGNPALLPRDRVGTYTVGTTKIDGNPAKGDRLVIIGGDDQSNNVYWSDNCGVVWNCFDGQEPWTKAGKSFAPIETLSALPGSPLIMGGGFDNVNPGGGLRPSAKMYYTFTGGAGTWLPAYDLPLSGVFPGMLAQDWSRVYLFGNASTGFAVWALDEDNYNTSGWELLPGSAEGSGGDVGRRLYLQGAVSGGCFFATDANPGELWGGARDPTLPPLSSSSTFYTAASATGPWVAGTAPWAPRSSAAVVLASDRRSAIVAGGVVFAQGAPTGEVLSDAWAVDASVCLLGAGGAVCGGHGTPDLGTVTCACSPGFGGSPVCDPSSASPSKPPSPSAAARATPTPQPPAPGSGGGSAAAAAGGALSPGASAGLALGLLVLALGGGAWAWAAYGGGGPVMAAWAKSAGGLWGGGGGGGGERASLLRRATITRQAAADRFGGSFAGSSSSDPAAASAVRA